MTDKYFLDSNVIIYSLGEETEKKNISNSLLNKNPLISVQVINEVINISLKKLKLSKEESFNIGKFLIKKCFVTSLEIVNIETAMYISRKYDFSFWDSLIVANALDNNCSILYSEDLQHNQLIENRLRVINPFI